jgi:superfamily I DNA and RNA helicase
MEMNLEEAFFRNDHPTGEMVSFFQANEDELGLEEAQLYYEFPILKDSDDKIVIAKTLLLSPNHGVIAIDSLSITNIIDTEILLKSADADLEQVFSLIYSRLIRNKSLRKSKTDLLFPTNSIIFAPNLDSVPEMDIEAALAINTNQLQQHLARFKVPTLSSTEYNELIATIEGAKGLIRPALRNIENLGELSKGALANRIESEITRFDRRQKHGAMAVLDGIQRIRGLAGSGKTVVLAMKAALTHLKYPQATIVYTFYTKSLYQQIKRLVTRFYRQFDDKDPDWSKLKIMHGWGGYSGEGVYFNACIATGTRPIKLSEAKAKGASDPFDFACRELIRNENIKPMYDYMLIDEGQDFPASFIQLCLKLTTKNRIVYAYDELQTIFQPHAPEFRDIVGSDVNAASNPDYALDVVLYKCYRNPREILVCAHALGFGIYSNIVQMLENKEQWEDIGYKVIQGDFIAGSDTVIERPENNSLTTISNNQSSQDIVSMTVYGTFQDEVDSTLRSITKDISEGLRPDDILVISVDDRHAKTYLHYLTQKLTELGIQSNNIHDDSYGIRDFHMDGCVTLSTVHKAKGNETFMVYVLGVDALYRTYAGVRERNLLFTAMTRAKGWVRISGIGAPASACKAEIDLALQQFPLMEFKYPSREQLKIIKRDLAEKAVRKLKSERKLDEVLDELSEEEVMRYLQQRAIKKG